MSIAPKKPKDLSLAPVAAEIDLNLQRLRDRDAQEVEREIQLELDSPPIPNTRDQRAARVLRVAFRDVDPHGWEGTITEDGSRLHLAGGSVTIDLGLGRSLSDYIATGA